MTTTDSQDFKDVYAYRFSSVSLMLDQLKWPTLQIRRKLSRLQILHKIHYQQLSLQIPHYYLPKTRPTSRAAHRGGGGGGATGAFCPGPQPKRGPMKGPLNTCLKDRYTLIEQSDLNSLIEQSQYSSEEQCSKLIDKEIWLVMGSYCHCQQVMTFFFFFLVFTLQLGSRAPL